MPSYYTYLIAGLPMLHFTAKPPFTFERFIEICRGLIPPGELEMLSSASIKGDYQGVSLSPTLEKWRNFDTALRNELVKIRAVRRKQEPLGYLRQTHYIEAGLAHLAAAAFRNPSTLEAERMLDEERWGFLEELSAGHYFDLDFLIAYAHKLLILQRWEKVRASDKPKVLAEAIGG
ncbi:MAG: hypothetical protein WC469_03340 [Candidatus Omnitrophota bacterium]|jgi:hypothetical protein